MLLNLGHYQHCVEEILNDVANLNKEEIVSLRRMKTNPVKEKKQSKCVVNICITFHSQMEFFI